MSPEDQAGRCPGPMVWFDVPPEPDRGWTPAAVLACGWCGDLIVTGSYFDARHVDVPLLRSPA